MSPARVSRGPFIEGVLKKAAAEGNKELIHIIETARAQAYIRGYTAGRERTALTEDAERRYWRDLYLLAVGRGKNSDEAAAFAEGHYRDSYDLFRPL